MDFSIIAFDFLNLDTDINSERISIKKTDNSKILPPKELHEYFPITQNNRFILS